jgi:hypothetical protein
MRRSGRTWNLVKPSCWMRMVLTGHSRLENRSANWVYRRGFIERVQMCLETSADQILGGACESTDSHIRDVTQLCELQGVIDALPHLDRLTGWNSGACTRLKTRSWMGCFRHHICRT